MIFLYVKWFLFLFLSFFMGYIINWPLAPFIVLFVKEDGYLPKWLNWFQTNDNPLDGDSGWQTESRPFLLETNKIKKWYNRFSWIRRNKIYGFSQSVLGVKYDYEKDSVSVVGDPLVGNGLEGKEGTVWRFLHQNGKIRAFQFYYIKRFTRWPNKCIRINLGWKIWSFGDPLFPAAHHVFSPSPFMTFRGK